MIIEMPVPSPGESISEVEIAQWLVKDGDYVEKDQTIAEVDSDKATLDLPAQESGIITLKASEGDTVEVGGIVCLIDTTAKKPTIKKSSENKDEIIEEQKNEIELNQGQPEINEVSKPGVTSPSARRPTINF